MKRRAAFLLATAALLLACLAIGAGPASASTGITRLSAEPSATQAGGHPNVEFSIETLSRSTEGAPCQCDDPRTIEFHFPTGFIGDPHALPLCTLNQFNVGNCPAESQVGTVGITLGATLVAPLYNMETKPNQAGQLGFTFPLLAFPVFIELSSRTDGDYGLDSATFPIVHTLVFSEIGLTLWGVPAASENDFYRFVTPLIGFGECGFAQQCGDGKVSGIPSNDPPTPYLQNPTTCGVPLTFGADVTYYTGQHYHAETPWPPTTGCNQLTFNPSIAITPTTTEADTATGMDIDLKVPQAPSATTPSPSEIKTARVTLPAGFSINPNAANGKLTCSGADTGIGTRGPATCPEQAKIGTLMLDVAALPAPIPGALYLAEPLPGERYRVLLAADGFATHIKLYGTVGANPETGQLEIAFVELPQSPLQEFNMHIFGSERGLLATPDRCGTYRTRSEFVPWDNVLPVQASTGEIEITSGPGGSPCPGQTRPFAPAMEAGVKNPTGGAFSPFTLRLTRPDGDQNLAGLSLKAPPGFLASLRGVAYCPESAIARMKAAGYTGLSEFAGPACPASSQVGTATVSAGAGSRPVSVGGRVFLAGPYKGAPLSLVVSIPVVSGPYDLGNVAIRAALDVDPATARVSAVSDPFPQILEGIPLRTRSVQIELDRPNFTVNPTNCDPFAMEASILGSEGAAAAASSHFQAAYCAELPYQPKLSLRLDKGINRRGHPAIHARLTMSPGEAGVKAFAVTLPKGELLDNAHLGTVCTRAAFSADTCPEGSRIGTATVATPLLDAPLSGNVYLRTSSHRLPDLVVDLEGQIEIELAARIDSPHERLRASFENVPDAPISSVSLDLLGGAKGLVQNSAPLCGSKKAASVRTVGQNGIEMTRKTKLSVACGKARRR